MEMSNHIRALNREEDERNARELAALWQQSDRLRSDTRTMSEVLADVPVRPSYNQPQTLVAENSPSDEGGGMAYWLQTQANR